MNEKFDKIDKTLELLAKNQEQIIISQQKLIVSQEEVTKFCEFMLNGQERIEKRLDSIEDNINVKFDKMLSHIDYLVKTTEDIKQDSTVISHRIIDHEDRITALEG